LLIVALVLLSACASHTPTLGGDPNLKVLPAAELPAPEISDLTAPGKPYFVGPYDKLQIDVYGLAELSGREVQVDSLGQIAFPVAGRIDVFGKTPAEISEILAQRLRANFVRDPQVTVNLKESSGQIVTVDGQVTKPGLYPVAGHMSLLRTMALAGGLTEFAKLDDIVVFRTVKGELFANDVVVVGDSSSRRLFKDILQFSPLLMTPLVIAIDRLSS
jgi:polysaccharide export outer membrane protein